MILTLSIKQRITFAGIFAGNNDTLTEAAVQRSIVELIALDKIEAKEISLKVESGTVMWNPRIGADKTFEIDDTKAAYLKETIYNLSKARKVTQDLLPICEKIAAM